jgi:hypothetical protein
MAEQQFQAGRQAGRQASGLIKTQDHVDRERDGDLGEHFVTESHWKMGEELCVCVGGGLE